MVGILACPALACNITTSPASASGSVGEVLSFTINVQLEHRNCTVPIDQTQIKLTGLEMASQTAWQKVNTNNYKKQISVKVTDAASAKIEVTRECPKGGGYAVANVTVKPLAAIASPSSPVSAPSPVSSTISIISVTPQINTDVSQVELMSDNPAEKSWGQAFIGGITEPYILATIILLLLSTIIIVKRFYRLRYLILLASLAYLGFMVGGCPCTLGSLQNIIIKAGEIQNHIPAYLQVGILIVSAILLGRLFCGWVCPMGAVQTFIYRKEIGNKHRNIAESLTFHKYLRYLKYLVLAGIIISAIVTRTAIYARFDPFKALFNFDFTLLVPTVLLILLLIISLFSGFPWCKYVCPMGAFLSIFSRLAIFKIKIAGNCSNCGACQKVFCQHGAIKSGETKPEINQVECVRCGECISHCPRSAIQLTHI